MWHPTVPYLELVVRGVLVYALLLVLLRLTGKRQIGQLSPFDLVLLLVLSNAVQNAMNGGDNSFTAGVVSATTLVAMNWLVAFATYKSRRLEALVEGRPQIVIHDGKLYEAALANEKLTRHELFAALRGAGCASVEDVRAAILESNGSLTVIPRSAPKGEGEGPA